MVIVVRLRIVVLPLHLREVFRTPRRDKDIARQQDIFLKLEKILTVGVFAAKDPCDLLLQLLMQLQDVLPLDPVLPLGSGHFVLFLLAVVSLGVLDHLVAEVFADDGLLVLADAYDR